MLRKLGYIVVLTSFVGGPGTELALAIHLAHAGPNHHGDNCPICIQLTIGSASSGIDPPTLMTTAETLFFKSARPSQDPAVAAHEQTPQAPRAPPVYC